MIYSRVFATHPCVRRCNGGVAAADYGQGHGADLHERHSPWLQIRPRAWCGYCICKGIVWNLDDQNVYSRNRLDYNSRI